MMHQGGWPPPENAASPTDQPGEGLVSAGVGGHGGPPPWGGLGDMLIMPAGGGQFQGWPCRGTAWGPAAPQEWTAASSGWGRGWAMGRKEVLLSRRLSRRSGGTISGTCFRVDRCQHFGKGDRSWRASPGRLARPSAPWSAASARKRKRQPGPTKKYRPRPVIAANDELLPVSRGAGGDRGCYAVASGSLRTGFFSCPQCPSKILGTPPKKA